MDDSFEIEFDVDGVHYAGKILPKYQELETYFQVHFHPSDQEREDKILYVEMNNSGEWVEKSGMPGQITVSHEFIDAVGHEIENNQV